MQTAQHKKLYENALSFGQSSESLQKALNGILRLAITDHSHFNFLLHNIHWFTQPYFNHISILEKALRIYRGKGKLAEKVAYNILTDGMWSSQSWKKSCDCLINLVKTGYDSKLLIQSLRQNYPHKVTQLEVQQNYLNSLLHLFRNVNQLRFDVLQIMLLQLGSFDTELCTGDSFSQQIFPHDSQIRAARIKTMQDPDHQKFDVLVTWLLEQLSKLVKDERLFSELLLIFKNDLVIIDQTKYIQFIIYFFAEQTKRQSKNFVSFLFCQIIEQMKSKTHNKSLISLNSYLTSYVCRSKTLNNSSISKIVENLINLVNQNLNSSHIKQNNSTTDTEKQQEQLNLGQLFQKYFELYLILQTIMQIWIGRTECRQANTKKFSQLLSRCKKQIHFHFFINPQILYKLQELKSFELSWDIKNYRCLQIYHKFNPPLLKRFSCIIDPLIRTIENQQNNSLKLEFIKSQVKQESFNMGMPIKRFKSEKKQSDATNI